MSILRRLKEVLFGRKQEKSTLQQEIEALNQIVVGSLSGMPPRTISPTDIFPHTGRIKEIVTSGQYALEPAIRLRLLASIEHQESMIQSCYDGYANVDPALYNSQVGSSITEIVKDVMLFLR